MADEKGAQLKSEIEAYVDEVWEDVVADISTLCSIPSVEDLDHAAPGAPWGPEPRRALECSLQLASHLGLDAHDCEGYMGYADLAGASKTQVATIAHTDVVPAGPGWSSDPFKVERREGFLVGRGVLDDKGPAVLSLYAAHFFQRRGEQLPYTLRVMLGNNEETGMGDLDYYLAHYEEPAFLFTPDAEFPVCCGEKGGFSAVITSGSLTDGIIASFDGGQATNAIPGLATATVRAQLTALPAATGIVIEPAGEGLVTLTAHGKGGHASLPAGTRNAIGMLVEYLLANDLCAPSERRFLELEHLVFASTDGSTLGIDATDDLFEPLTCIGGTIHLVDGHLVQTIDSRYPKSTTAERIEATLSQLVAGYGATLEVKRVMVPFYVNPTSPEICTLIDTYNECTGKNAVPFTIGGGTYARHFKNAASFGPEEPSEKVPEWVGQMHGPDEAVSEELLRRSLLIYILAIARLMRLSL